MIRPILPKYLWDRIDRNLTTQGKGRAWENYEPGKRNTDVVFKFKWKVSFEGELFWMHVIDALTDGKTDLKPILRKFHLIL